MQWLAAYLSGQLLLEIRQGATIYFRHHYYPLNKCRSDNTDAELWFGGEIREQNTRYSGF